MENYKRGLLPIPHGTILASSQFPSTKSKLEIMNGIPYASLIGSIMYAVLCTRSYVLYALIMMTRYQQNMGKGHWIAIKNIIKYLRRTK